MYLPLLRGPLVRGVRLKNASNPTPKSPSGRFAGLVQKGPDSRWMGVLRDVATKGHGDCAILRMEAGTPKIMENPRRVGGLCRSRFILSCVKVFQDSAGRPAVLHVVALSSFKYIYIYIYSFPRSLKLNVDTNLLGLGRLSV